MRLSTIVLATTILCAGCANPYAKFYQGNPDARTNPRYVAAPGPVQIYTINDFPRDRALLMTRGFVQIGESSFTGASDKVTREQLVEQAQKIGAEVVLSKAQYSHTVNGSTPLTLPTTNTSFTNGRATAYGSNGSSATAYGSSTTTTYGTQTTMVPFSVDRSNFGAVYFARVRPRIGIWVQPLPDDMRRARASNAGVIVDIVVENSPAFAADLLPGDLIVSINGQAVAGVEGFNRISASIGSQPVTFSIARGDKTFEKVITQQP